MNIFLFFLSFFSYFVFIITAVAAENFSQLRDPFRMPEIQSKKFTPKTELENYPIDSYKLVGVLTGPERLRAMVLGPNGKTYFVGEKMKIGTRGGTIKKINPDFLQIREKIVNLVGKEEYVDTKIQMSVEDFHSEKED